MSAWDSYIDNLIANGEGNVSKAVIIGLEGGAWTSATHASALAIGNEEITPICSTFKSGDLSKFQQNGITIGNEKYRYVRSTNSDDNSLEWIFCKKKDAGSISLQRTKLAIILAYTPNGKSDGKASTVVSKLAKYLKDQNY